MALLFKYADLQPPLGLAGGPCRVVDRILKEKLPPGEAEELVSLVDRDQDLTNQQAHEVYDPLIERGPHPFNQFVLTPHSQYRMDLRSVTIRDLREALSHFVSEIEDWKRKRDPRYRQLLQSDRQKMEWVDPKSGLFFVFGFGSHKGTPSLITTYWKNRKTPEAPAGGCQIRGAGYQAPAADLAGVRTFVDEKPAKGINDPLGDSIYHAPGETWKSDRERSLPETTDNNVDLVEHRHGPPVYNTPGPATKGQPASPNPQSQFKMRTPGTPGEEYGHPYKDNVYPRRTATGEGSEEEMLQAIREAAGAGMFPTYDSRQHKQKSYAKRYYQKNYRRRKNRIRMQAKRRYKKIRNSPEFKRRKSLRNMPKYHNRFRRLPAGGARSIAERSRKEREDKKASSSLPLSFYHEVWGWGDLLGFEDEGLLVHIDGDTEDCEVVPLRAFTSGMVFETDEDLDTFFSLLEEAYGSPDPRAVAATFYREVYRPGYNMDPGPGAQNLGEPSPVNPSLPYPDQEHRDRAQSHDIEVYRERGEMPDTPGSAKVIPSGHGFVNKEASSQRVASAWRVAKRLAELLGETSTDVLLRAKTLRPKGKRFDQKNAMYTFSVPGATSKETYVVRMKVSRPAKNVSKLGRMDLEVSCSCPFWQWQGPEHWAKFGNYLYGSPRGTASKPSIKDPTSIHKVCKHVAATLDMVKNWELPTGKV